MTYKETITNAMTALAKDPARIFVGYGITSGRAMGTLKDVPKEQLLESPVAENLMMGVAIGLSLAGRKPVVYFERADFIYNAMDSIVNHLNAMATLSRGEFKPSVIIRVTVGNSKKPLYTGPVHTANPAEAFRNLVDFSVMEPCDALTMESACKLAEERQDAGTSSAIFEFKDNL